MDSVAGFKEKKIDSCVDIEKQLFDHTHTFMIVCDYKDDEIKVLPENNSYVDFDWNKLKDTGIRGLVDTVYRPDRECFHSFIDLSGVRSSVERRANIRLYAVPHIYSWFRISMYVVCEEAEVSKVIMYFTNIEIDSYCSCEFDFLDKMDVLTQLPNIDTFSTQTRDLFDSYPDKEFVIIRVDMNKFRLLNQLYGTKEGDSVLKYISVKLQECMDMEENYTICHLFSDIFAVCMENREENVRGIIEDIQSAMGLYPIKFELVLSFGIYKVTSEDIEKNVPIVTLVDRAAIAQRIKNNYMNSVAVFDDKIAQKELREQNVILEMNDALAGNQFHVYLQPKVDMLTKRIVGSEALVRWIHPVKGIISPADFVPIFESNGFVAEIDYYMLRRVCEIIRKWLDSGIPSYPVSVNLSRTNLYNPNLLDQILECVEKYHIPHNLIEFEITESAFVNDNVHLVNLIKELQKKEFKILMDDFGSGYSALNSLRELTVDVLKIDIKFLPISKADKRADIILRSVVEMANRLGLDTVVEGVEMREQEELLREMGCRVAQGYYYYRPVSVEDYEKCVTSVVR